MAGSEPHPTPGLDTPAGLRAALQQAVTFEQTVLPSYLYARYSLGPDANPDVFFVLKRAVMQQMSHLGLACNVLNAIGGAPVIADRAVVPRYPAPLPGCPGGELVVPLGPLSRDLARDVFMRIEEPERPVTQERPEPGGRAIDAFYRAVGGAIAEQGESLFKGDPKRQVGGLLDLAEVTDPVSAAAALDTIVEQGQGAADSPHTAFGSPAHYYGFAQLVHGRELVESSSPPPLWVFEGAPIEFDPAAVLPVATNPRASDYPEGSPARTVCVAFNRTYTSLLQHLQAGFDGARDRVNDAIGDMFALNGQAAELLEIELPDGTRAGPSFEFVPDA